MILLAQHTCCRLLGIDPKTLRRWTTLALIPFLKSPLDARLRCLTPASLESLATLHDRPLASSLPADDPSSIEQEKHHAPSPVPEPPESLSLAQLHHLVETLQVQLTQLALDLLHERNRREEQERRAKEILLASQPRASNEYFRPEEPKAASSARKGRPRSLVPLIAAQPDGSYLVISPQHGELHISVDSRQWFAWLDSLSSFRFVGKAGRLSTYRKRGKASWIASRRIHGHVTSFSLGPTQHLSVAHLEQMASLLQPPVSSQVITAFRGPSCSSSFSTSATVV